MAEVRIHHSELTLPAVPVVRIHQAQLDIPAGVVVRIHHSVLTLPSPATATVRVHYAVLTIPAAPDAAAPSGVRQFASSEAWWDAALHQRTSAGEWV